MGGFFVRADNQWGLVMQWKQSISFPSYEISECGHLRRAQTGRMRKPYSTTRGYPAYCLRRPDRGNVTAHAHVLVAEAFIGPKPFDGAEVCHKDGDKNNAHFTNLRWDTHKSNVADDGLGERNTQARLSEGDVRAIRRRVALGETQRSMSREFGVVPSVICDIVNLKAWAHVA